MIRWTVLKSVRDIHSRWVDLYSVFVLLVIVCMHAYLNWKESTPDWVEDEDLNARLAAWCIPRFSVIAIALVAINFAYLAWHHRHFDEEPVRYRICMIIAVISSILAASFIMLPAID